MQKIIIKIVSFFRNIEYPTLNRSLRIYNMYYTYVNHIKLIRQIPLIVAHSISL